MKNATTNQMAQATWTCDNKTEKPTNGGQGEEMPPGGFRGEESLPPGGFRGEEQLPPGGFRGEESLPPGGFRHAGGTL